MRRTGVAGRAGCSLASATKLPECNAWTLCRRSIVERQSGNLVQANADRTVAPSLDAQISERVHKIGLNE